MEPGGADSARSPLPTGTVGFLITDIEGSTALYRRLGAHFEDLLERHREICRQAFARHDGVEVACPGDGFIVAFDAVTNALAAAVDAQRGLAAHAWPEAAPIRVRMGVHVGEARLTASGGTYLGLGLHEATRIGDAGSGGQIVVSGPACDAIGTDTPAGVTLAPLGSYRLRGLEEGYALFEARGDGLATGFPPLRIAAEPVGNITGGDDDLVGRADALAEVARAVGRHRLVTLVGPGGVGKTRLATAAAQRLTGAFDDGCWFVDLAAMPAGATADEVATVVGAAVSVEASHGAAGLATAIAARHVLLVIDNCEHVLAGANETVRRLLDAGARIAVLATSQAPLSLRDECVITVEPLAVRDAATLFVRRAAAAAPAARLDAADADIAHICRQVDGLPLAIELAANRIRVLSPRDIAARLEDRFALLKGNTDDTDARHRTLRATIEWSYGLLEPAEQLLLRRLAVFSGGAELAAVEAVCADDALPHAEVLDGVTALIERSLLNVERVGDRVRYTMLASIRDYAHSQLRAAGELDALRARHLDHFAERSWQALWAMHRGTVTDEFRRLGDEADNLRAAIAWSLDGGSVDAGLRLACGAGFFGRECAGGYVYASRDWIHELLGRGAAANDAALRCQALLASASVCFAEGDWARLATEAEAALALVESDGLGDDLRAQALGMVGVAAEQAHPLREAAALNESIFNDITAHGAAVPSRSAADAVPLLQAAAEVARREGLDGFRVIVLTNLSSAALQIGNREVGRSAAETALAEARHLGLTTGEARALNRMSYVALREGDVAGAADFAAEALVAAEGSGAAGETAATRAVLASLCVLRGDNDTAKLHADAAAELFASLGHWVPLVRMWATGSAMYYAIGQPALGREALERLIAALPLIGDHPAVPLMLVTLIPQAEAAGDHDLVSAIRPYASKGATPAEI